VGVDALVFEVDAGEVQGEAALLAAAHGSVEVGQLWFVHKVKRTITREWHPGIRPWSIGPTGSFSDLPDWDT
jgi:hypothetical protein